MSVIGLAPIKLDLKGRLRELLCIHGHEWSPEVGFAPTSQWLQRCANLPQLLGEMDCRTVAECEGWSSPAVTLRGHSAIRVLAQDAHITVVPCHSAGDAQAHLAVAARNRQPVKVSGRERHADFGAAILL